MRITGPLFDELLPRTTCRRRSTSSTPTTSPPWGQPPAAPSHGATVADDLSSLIRTAIDATEGRTLRDFLKETGLEDAEAEWREDLEAQVAEQAQAVVATDAFRSWLDDLMR